MRRFWLPLSAALIATMCASVASCSPILSNPTFTSGGLTFSNFSCSFQPQSSGTVVGNCNNVSVVGMGAGVAFTSGVTTSGNGTPDMQIALGVAGGPITSVGLSFTPVAVGPVNLSITETIYASPNSIASQTPLATLLVSCIATAGSSTCGAGSNLSASATIPSSTSLYILKDVAYVDQSNTAVGNITAFTQTFGTPIPEPVAMGMLGGGLTLFGLVGLRRRK